MSRITDDRRALHRIPELDRDLPRTMEYLRGALGGLRCALSSPIPGSLCAWFDNGAERALAFRSDADALPVCEATGAAYASTHPGRMHACGHDGHMAMLLELARRLDGMESDRNYLLIFQPAEETTGGAHDICESGILAERRVEALFGMHLWPGLEKGQIFSRPGEMMARSCEVTIDITGKSCHIAQPEGGRDALRAAVDLLGRAREIEANQPEGATRVLNFGRMESGTARNALSARTHIEGTLRAFQDEIFFGMRDALFAAADEIAAATGCPITITTSEGYPAVMNPPELCERVRECGIEFEPLARPAMTTEDFSWYQRYVPAQFFFLGLGGVPPLHAANFDFDESVLQAGADFYEQLARNFRA